MELLEAIVRRRSIRRFKDKEISEGMIGDLLTAFKWAPSAGNRQPWMIIVVKDEDLKEELAEIALEQMWIAKAPVIMAVFINEKKARATYGGRGKDLYAIQGTSAAIQNMLLRATDLGLGSCWVGAFEEDQVRTTLDCEDWLRPIALIPVGYPAEERKAPGREDINEFVRLNRWGKRLIIDEWEGLDKSCKEAKRKARKFLHSFRDKLEEQREKY